MRFSFDLVLKVRQPFYTEDFLYAEVRAWYAHVKSDVLTTPSVFLVWEKTFDEK